MDLSGLAGILAVPFEALTAIGAFWPVISDRSQLRVLERLSAIGEKLEAHAEHLRPALTVMFGAHLRLGELIGLQRGDVDLASDTLRVERQVVVVRQVDSAGQSRTTTETTLPKGGRPRTVALPAITLEALRTQLSGSRGFARSPLFAQRDGRPFTHSQLQQAWRKAADAVGLPDAHLHDLRHAGLTLAAQTGATLAELKQRAGHSTAAAAMRYQHAAEERGAVIEAGMNAALSARCEGATGTQLAREALDA